MNEEAKKNLVTEWVQHYSVPITDTDEVEFLESDRVLFFANNKDPELCWELILRIFNSTENENALKMLAAGPLEDFIAHNGIDQIETIEEYSVDNYKFRKVLTYVWQNATPNNIWERIQQLQITLN